MNVYTFHTNHAIQNWKANFTAALLNKLELQFEFDLQDNFEAQGLVRTPTPSLPISKIFITHFGLRFKQGYDCWTYKAFLLWYPNPWGLVLFAYKKTLAHLEAFVSKYIMQPVIENFQSII